MYHIYIIYIYIYIYIACALIAERQDVMGGEAEAEEAKEEEEAAEDDDDEEEEEGEAGCRSLLAPRARACADHTGVKRDFLLGAKETYMRRPTIYAHHTRVRACADHSSIYM